MQTVHAYSRRDQYKISKNYTKTRKGIPGQKTFHYHQKKTWRVGQERKTAVSHIFNVKLHFHSMNKSMFSSAGGLRLTSVYIHLVYMVSTKCVSVHLYIHVQCIWNDVCVYLFLLLVYILLHLVDITRIILSWVFFFMFINFLVFIFHIYILFVLNLSSCFSYIESCII